MTTRNKKKPRSLPAQLAPVIRLVPDYISGDSVEALKALLNDAEKGYLVGVAFAAIYKRHRFACDVTGEARRNPVLARGMIASLDTMLERQVERSS